MERYSGLLGIVIIIGLGWLCSRQRSAIRWRVVGWGLGLQVAFALLVLRVPLGARLFAWIGGAVGDVLSFASAGTAFLFGPLGRPDSSLGVIFAFQLLPTIIFVSALFAMLYHVGVMPILVRAMSRVMTRLLGASGAEGVVVSASIFMGQTEAPLTIRPYIPGMTNSELMTVMTSGMAHVAAAIMAAYIAFGVEAKYLLAAVIMTAPGTILMAKLFEPEIETPRTDGTTVIDLPHTDVNLVAAAARGAGEGLFIMLHVGAMLIAFLGLIALTNAGLGWLHSSWSVMPESLQSLLGFVGRPVAWLIGVPWHDSASVGSLLGTRAVLNEFIAYSQLGPMKASLEPRSFIIATIALAGFANIASVGIQLGAMGALAPERKSDLARVGFRSLLAGSLANFLAAAIVGLMV